MRRASVRGRRTTVGRTAGRTLAQGIFDDLIKFFSLFRCAKAANRGEVIKGQHFELGLQLADLFGMCGGELGSILLTKKVKHGILLILDLPQHHAAGLVVLFLQF